MEQAEAAGMVYIPKLGVNVVAVFSAKCPAGLMRFIGIARPDEFQETARCHVIAWRMT
jgi:hypothetical protein